MEFAKLDTERITKSFAKMQVSKFIIIFFGLELFDLANQNQAVVFQFNWVRKILLLEVERTQNVVQY